MKTTDLKILKSFWKSIHLCGCLLIVFLLSNCKSTQVSKTLSSKLSASFYDTQFTGLMVYNPRTKDTVYKYNADKYFTPASNTKIFTLFTALHFLPEKIPAFKYHIDNDTIMIRGTGDPTFLHPFFKDSTAIKMIGDYKNVQLIINNLSDAKFGPGWAWEDYDTYFSPERSSFPMYGNVVTVTIEDSLKVIPHALRKNTQYTVTNKIRDFNANNFYYRLGKQSTEEIPMVIDSVLIQQLWDDLIPGKVIVKSNSHIKLDQVAYGIPSDSLYKRMMQVSDNFLAEQMLILSSSMVSDTLSTNEIRDSILNNQLKDLKQRPRWVDGSGLSRYNLFTPMSFVQVLEKLYTEIPRERLFNFFPVGGNIGTLKNWYGSDKGPYIFAKSGTVGNNYSLSGYLLTNSGEVLIFSFMNNHYTKSSSEVKQHMQMVFEYLRENY